MHVLNVWTIVFFVKAGESRIERIAEKANAALTCAEDGKPKA
jgi:hypothetical protein